MKFNINVKVNLKPEILDIQGKAILQALRNAGETSVQEVFCGKVIRLAIEAENLEAAKNKADKIANELLSNPIIETYELMNAE